VLRLCGLEVDQLQGCFACGIPVVEMQVLLLAVHLVLLWNYALLSVVDEKRRETGASTRACRREKELKVRWLLSL
jgi:hypothetical protein